MNKADPVSNTVELTDQWELVGFFFKNKYACLKCSLDYKMPILPSLSLLLIPFQPVILRVTPALESYRPRYLIDVVR